MAATVAVETPDALKEALVVIAQITVALIAVVALIALCALCACAKYISGCASVALCLPRCVCAGAARACGKRGGSATTDEVIGLVDPNE